MISHWFQSLQLSYRIIPILQRHFSYTPDTSPLFVRGTTKPEDEEIITSNLRSDKFLSTVFDVSRHKIDVQFEKKLVYLNGSNECKPAKKINKLKKCVFEIDWEAKPPQDDCLYTRDRVEIFKVEQCEDKGEESTVFVRKHKLYGRILSEELTKKQTDEKTGDEKS